MMIMMMLMINSERIESMTITCAERKSASVNFFLLACEHDWHIEKNAVQGCLRCPDSATGSTIWMLYARLVNDWCCRRLVSIDLYIWYGHFCLSSCKCLFHLSIYCKFKYCFCLNSIVLVYRFCIIWICFNMMCNTFINIPC